MMESLSLCELRVKDIQEHQVDGHDKALPSLSLTI